MVEGSGRALKLLDTVLELYYFNRLC